MKLRVLDHVLSYVLGKLGDPRLIVGTPEQVYFGTAGSHDWFDWLTMSRSELSILYVLPEHLRNATKSNR